MNYKFKYNQKVIINPDKKDRPWYQSLIFEIIDAEIKNTGNVYTLVCRDNNCKIDIHEDYLVNYHGTEAWRFEKFEKFYDDF